MNNQPIFIIGYGAIGKALAVFLTSLGKKTVVIRGRADNGSVAYEQVAVEQANGTMIVQSIEVVTLKNIDKIDGLIILTTKSFGNTALSKALKPKVRNAPIVILQNGLNIEKPFLENGFSHIYRCVLFATSQVLENGVVRFRPVSDSPIGIIKGNAATLNNLAGQIDSEYFQFKPEKNIQPVIWKKAIINTVFNSICPLLNADNGIFYKDPLALQVAESLIRSGIIIAKKAGVELDPKDVETGLLNISKASAGQFISTLQDISNGRNTEIEALNFEIARVAKTGGIATEAKQIELLGELIKLKERMNLKNAADTAAGNNN